MVATAGFAHGRSEAIGLNESSESSGTTITAGTSNAKGTPVLLGTPSFQYEWVNVSIGGSSAAADHLIDIMVDDGSGNRFVLIPDLHYPARKAAGEFGINLSIPVRCPMKAIYARSGSSTNSATCRVSMVGTSVGPKGATGYSQVIALNSFGTSRGLALDAGGTANTWPGWTQVNASTAKSVDMIFMVLGNNADVARTAVSRGLFKLGLGSAGNEFDLIPATQWGYTTTSDSPFPSVVGPIPCAIPPGSRIAAQARCTDNVAGDRTFDLSVYGLVP